jgi:hypothetical protein
MVDLRTGCVTREWYPFLMGLQDRSGGATGPSTTDLAASMFEDSGIEETKATLFRLADDVNQLPAYTPDAAPPELVPPSVPFVVFEQILTELQAQRDQIAELTKTIQGLQQGLTLL